ncbi:hypothetical protein KSP40_PGU003713 [Platanthera guangdongensis]|uniref:Uncharacterized protein n=1 Tax=Platanthera guangdongensis TaxID=2320717 RepID=A0ABR2LUZ1_9ASPA
MASARTYRPDRKALVMLLDSIHDNLYHPKHNWTLSIRQNLNHSLGIDGLIKESQMSKPKSFLSHPLPECSCRASKTSELQTPVKGPNGELLYGGEERCPDWMVRGLSFVLPNPRTRKMRATRFLKRILTWRAMRILETEAEQKRHDFLNRTKKWISTIRPQRQPWSRFL